MIYFSILIQFHSLLFQFIFLLDMDDIITLNLKIMKIFPLIL